MKQQKKLRVLHVGKFYPPHRGGMETHLHDLCEELRTSLDVCALVASDRRRTDEQVVDGVSVVRMAKAMTLFATPLCPSLPGRIANHGADLVHIHWPNPAAVLGYLMSGYRGHLVVTYHSDTIRQRFLGRLIEPLLHATLRRSSAIIATSPQYSRTSPVLAAYRDRCHVIPLGIPLQRFAHRRTVFASRLREQYGDRLILSVGRLVYYKGFDHLIRAMSQVRGRLLIIGDGPLRSKLTRLAAHSGVTDKVVFLGEAPDGQMADYYQAADIFALASVARSEAFGIVQVEAMAAGRPVVNTQLNSGVPFVSLDGSTGITVPPANAAALAVALNRLLDDPALRLSYGDAGRARARKEFSVEVMAASTLSLYQQVMAQAVGHPLTPKSEFIRDGEHETFAELTPAGKSG